MGFFDYFKRKNVAGKKLLTENITVQELNEDLKSKSFLREQYKQGKIKLDEGEMEILKFTHGRDMRKFLEEEFKKNPTPTNFEGCPFEM